MADTVLEAALSRAATDLARTMAVELVAQRRHHDHVARDYSVAGMAARILAAGDDFRKAGSEFRWGPAPSLSGQG
jgi:hypothetical protein